MESLKVFVTGASSGIGEATAKLFLAQGAQVALVGRRKDKLEEIVRQAQPDKGAAYPYELDIVDSQAAGHTLEQFVDEVGGLNLLVNCAGVGTWGPALEADLKDWDAMVKVNLLGLMHVTRLAMPHLVQAASGPRGVADIVSISSIAGRKVPGAFGGVYSATKHAVVAFSEGLRQELAPKHVRVGVIEPGIVATEMTLQGAPGAPDARNPKGFGFLQPEDIARAVLTIVEQPKHVAINELLIRPTEQVI